METLWQICDAPHDCELSDLPSVLSGIAVIVRKLENAGRAFFEEYEAIPDSESEDEEGVESRDATAKGGKHDAYDSTFGAEGTAKQKRKKAKLKGFVAAASTGASLPARKLKELTEPGPDGKMPRTLYEILQVEPSTAADEVRRAFYRLAKVYHPDKHKSKQAADGDSEQETPEDNGFKEEFIAIHEAFEILSEPSLRRQYESALPFDESIPSHSELGISKNVVGDPQQFYQGLHEAFKRNSKWSMNRPVPDFGNDDTSFEAVHRFYDFWFAFESWRDFSKEDEYDLVDAQHREERRWMEKMNAKERVKLEKVEHLRIRKLVDLATEFDPRLAREREEHDKQKRELKEAARREREAEQDKYKLIEEEKRKAQELEEAERKAAEDAKKQKQNQEKQQLRSRKRRVRCLVATFAGDEVSSHGLDDFCEATGSAGPTQMEDALGRLEAAENDMVAVLEKYLSACVLSDVKEQLTKRQAAKQNQKEDSLSLENPVPADVKTELGAAIDVHIKKHADAERQKEEEKIRIAAQIEADRKAAKTSQPAVKKAQAEWTTEELSMLSKGLQKYPGGTARRWHLIAALVQTKTAEQVIEKGKELADGTSLKGLGRQLSQGTQAWDLYQRNQKNLHADVGSAPEQREGSAPASNAQQPGAARWTEAECKGLEKALGKYPASMPPKERWTAIASELPDKTPKECIAKFKEIREKLLAAKANQK
eukprot:Selendium_serpulae@DN6244_c0_g1_i11.p1